TCLVSWISYVHRTRECSSPKEHLMFPKRHNDNCKVHSINVASMTNEQYDRLDVVSSIMLCIKEVYAVPNWHIESIAMEVFLVAKMTKCRLLGDFNLMSERQSAGHWMRKEGEAKSAAANVLSIPVAPLGKGKENRKFFRISNISIDKTFT
ncbi:UNVERIFIED_CONTAM: hypothetical protein Sindi_1685300, partial [Sesamum indicum]